MSGASTITEYRQQPEGDRSRSRGGNAVTRRQAFYGTQKWKDIRRAYRKSVGGLCERCLACGVIRPGKFVHHKIHMTDENMDDPTIALSFDNLELLCIECHAKEHDSHRYTVDVNGGCHCKREAPLVCAE